MQRRYPAAVALCIAVAAFASGGSDRASRGEGTVSVVATTATLADLVRNAGGDRVVVQSLVPKLADPHPWRPGAGARAKLEDADLVLTLGGDLDAWLDPVLAERPETRVLELLPKLEPLGHDSHWWQDPVRVQTAIKEIRNELARVDVHGAGHYEAASASYLARLRQLDQDTASCLRGAAPGRARIVAQHAGFRYFEDRYGIEVVGPGTPGGAKLGRRLWADTLGPRGSAAASYLGAFSLNVGAIVSALSDGALSCRPRV